MKKYYSINQICALTAVSVRTLHYYDEIDLLKPSLRTKKGSRRYTEEDLMRLQQIITLKHIGLSLIKIKKCLHEKEFNILDSLNSQANILTEEANRIKKVSRLLKQFIARNKTVSDVNWEEVIKIFALLNDNHATELWYEKYLSKNEANVFNQIVNTRKEEWQNLFAEIKQITHLPADNEEVQNVLAKMKMLAEDAYGQHPQLKEKIWQAYQAGKIPNVLYDENVVQFLDKITK